MPLPQGRPVIPRSRTFCSQVVLDHYLTGPSRKFWVPDDILVDRSAWHRQVLRDDINWPRESNMRRRVGVNPAAESSAVMSELIELGAGRARTSCARAPGSPLHTLAGVPRQDSCQEPVE